jgi:hypothetical protein
MITIDDFSSGPHALEVAPGSAPTSVRGCQSGTMLGGGRHTYLHVVQDPRGQPARLDAGSGYLDVSLGAEQVAHVDVMYGWAADNGSCTENPLVGTGNGDLLSMGNVIRTTFNSASTPDGEVNFNVIASSAGGRSQAGGTVNVSRTPVNIDFWLASTGPPDRKFGNAGLDVPPADFSALTFVVFRFQATGDFVIDSFEVI